MNTMTLNERTGGLPPEQLDKIRNRLSTWAIRQMEQHYFRDCVDPNFSNLNRDFADTLLIAERRLFDQKTLNAMYAADLQARRVKLYEAGHPLAIAGKARILQDTWAKALKAAYKTHRRTLKQRKAAGMAYPPFDRHFDITLHFQAGDGRLYSDYKYGRLTIDYPMVDPESTDDAMRYTRVGLHAPVRTCTDLPFSCRVDYALLKEVIDLCPAGEALELTYSHFANRLKIDYGTGRSQLVTYPDPLEHVYGAIAA